VRAGAPGLCRAIAVFLPQEIRIPENDSIIRGSDTSATARERVCHDAFIPWNGTLKIPYSIS
jgi:hypothetical protein